MERYQLIKLVDGLEKVYSSSPLLVEEALGEIKNILKESELKVPTREQVEKWKGEWIVKHDGFNEITIVECSECEDETVYESFFEEVDTNFCAACGRPMTDEAVEIMIERLSGIK